MKIIFISTLILSVNLTLFSQEDIIKEIKQQYYSISENSDFGYNHHDLEMNFILPAVGEKTKNIRFYYDSEQTDPEKDPYEMDSKLRKIELKFNVSASILYKFEYLYNENGQLIFYYEKAEGAYENYQKRYYLHNEKLIKCIVNETIENKDPIEYIRFNNFSQTDILNLKSGLKKAGRYFLLFKQLELIDKVD